MRLRAGRLRLRQASAEFITTRISGSQSERGAELGRRDGGNPDRTSASPSDAIAEDPGQHQCDRVGVLDCRAGLQERETLAWRRPTGALGGVGAPGCGEAVPPNPGTQT